MVSVSQSTCLDCGLLTRSSKQERATRFEFLSPKNTEEIQEYHGFRFVEREYIFSLSNLEISIVDVVVTHLLLTRFQLT